MLRVKYLLIISALLFYFFVLPACKSTRFVPEGKYLLRKSKIYCDEKNISGLSNYQKQKCNRKFFGFLYFNLATYNIFHSEKKIVKKRGIRRGFQRFRAWTAKTVGEKPVIWDSLKMEKSAEQMRKYMNSIGFYSAKVKTKTKKRGKKKIFVNYYINAGKAHKISKVEYLKNEKLSADMDSLIKVCLSATLLTVNSRFEIDKIKKERSRISDYLKNNGFYNFSKEYVFFKVDTTAGNFSTDIKIGVKEKVNSQDSNTYHKKYRINSIYIYPQFEPQKALLKKKTYFAEHDTIQFSDNSSIYINRYQKPFLYKAHTLINMLTIGIDSIYRPKSTDISYKRLSALSAYKMVNISFKEVKSVNDSLGKLDCNIKLTPATRQSYSLELEGSNFSSNAGMATNVVYRNKNLFRGSENFEIKTRFVLERNMNISGKNEDVFNSLEYGINGSLTIPRFLLPFRLTNFEKKFAPHTSFGVSFNHEERPDFKITTSKATFGYVWQSSLYSRHFFNIIDFSSIRVPRSSMSKEFKELVDTSYFKYSYEDLLISASNYRYLFNNQARKGYKDFFYFKYNLETAGNILSAFNILKDRNKKDKLELKEAEYTLFKMQYAQYVKTDIDFRYYHIIGRRQKTVSRIFAGFALPYGNLNTVPFEKKFFGGGAYSLRGWKVKSLGVGTHATPLAKVQSVAADIKLEFNFEYRAKVTKMFEIAMFTDIGNIWNTTKTAEDDKEVFRLNRFYKELAVGAGMGLRLDLSFFVFRVDWGFKVHNPVLPESKRWLGKHPDGFSSEVTFGIGYPF